jgi:hypothetical protein
MQVLRIVYLLAIVLSLENIIESRDNFPVDLCKVRFGFLRRHCETYVITPESTSSFQLSVSLWKKRLANVKILQLKG